MYTRTLAAAALLALTGAANAADLWAKTPATNSAPSWTGFYVGSTVGANSMQSTLHDNSGDEVTYYSAGFAAKALGVNYGGTLGFNWQVKSYVLGVEGDFNFTNANTGQVASYQDELQNEYHMQSQQKWFATARVRAGYAFDNVLLYGTGGFAFVNSHHEGIAGNYQCGNADGTYYGYCGNETSLGFAVGAGVEAKVTDNWSVKAEYLFLDMPTIVEKSTTPAYVNYYNGAFLDSSHIVRIGVNYHLH